MKSKGIIGEVWDDRFQAILNSALDAAIAMDAAGYVIDWNFRAEQIFGWTKQEAIGQLLVELIIPPPFRDAQRKGLQHYLATGEGPVLGRLLEMTALRKSGEEFPVELSVIAVPREDTFFFHAFLRDVSERTESARHRGRMAGIVDSSYDAIISKDIAGNIISWNSGATRVYGYTEREAIGQTIKLTLPHDTESEEPEVLLALQSGQRLEQFQTVRRRKDGTLIPISLTVSPITDDHGTIIGSSTIERDITVSQRQRQELSEAKAEAEEANRVRTEFLANVSHELRTPMNAIIGMTQIALGEKLTDDVRDYVQTANDAAHSLLTLLNDILDFSKLESGKFTIEAEPFSLREMFDETVKTLSARAFEKGLELACEVASDAPDQFVGDAVRLRQVFTNLIGNAIKFTEQGEVVVTIETLRKWPNETRLRFSVRDTGVGVSPGDQLRILEPFTQVDASSTRRYGGTGLGLTICRELVRLMGGRLRVESESGVGSCFSFRLTLPIQPEPTSDSCDSKPLDRLHGLPVLVVDDNETNRRIIANMLANWSMRADTARDGRQALARLDQARESGTPYALVIVDALMPQMDGYALSQQIAERTSDAPPLILMLSSSDRREFKLREERASISAFLQKPVSQSDLLDAVLRAMNAQVAISRETPPSSFVPVSSRVSLSILLAEDTPANQKIVTSILKKRGHAITVAGNGREAVELVHQQAFDVILMDVQMPIMDGLQATAAIREQEKGSNRSTPIIAMTAHAMRGDREKCLDAGMDAYIAKPIDMNQLIELVESVADGTTDSPLAPHNHDAAPKVSSTNGVIDFAGAIQRLGGDVDLFRDFIGYFDEDSPKLLAALREALHERDASAVQRAAHSIKGLAANFGAVLCVAVAHELEEIGKAGELETAVEVMARLEREFARLDGALAEHRS